MDLRQLEYFVAVAEELSFTRAAARCQVAQSALSHQIARLEREHEVTLFERTSRSVRLAPAGELLLPRARAVLAELDPAREHSPSWPGVLTGRLRLGSSAAPGGRAGRRAGPGRLPSGTPRRRRSPSRTPGSRHMADQVRGGKLDVAFIGLFADQVPDDLVHRVLAVEPLVAIVPQDHPLADRGRSASPNWPGRRRSSRCARSPGSHPGRRGVRPGGRLRRIAFDLDTSEAVVRYVGLGLGVARPGVDRRRTHGRGGRRHGDVAAYPSTIPRPATR